MTAKQLIERLGKLAPDTGIGVAMLNDDQDPSGGRTVFTLDNAYVVETTDDYLGGHFLFCLVSEAGCPIPNAYPVPANVADDLDNI